MNNRGYAYLLALFCLVFVSSIAFLWQQQLQAYPNGVSEVWARTVADQAALSGLEYGLELIKRDKKSQSFRVPVPGGHCNLKFVVLKNKTMIHSESSVFVLGKHRKTTRSLSVSQ